jgi:hypothetical protein
MLSRSDSGGRRAGRSRGEWNGWAAGPAPAPANARYWVPVLYACMHSHPLTPVGGRVVAVSRRSHELNDLRYVHDRRGQRVRRRSAVAPLPEQRGADTAERRRKEA